MNPITIVIPAYGHVASFIECVQSVLHFGDLGTNNLIIVNDSGPEADSIEEQALRLTSGNPHVVYSRNNSNLGFVKTCNRAVYDLDPTDNDVLLLNSDAKLTPGALVELSQVLHASEKHGAACPRSSNAGLSTLPFFPRDEGQKKIEQDEDANSFALFEKINSHLPRFKIVPVAIGFCILIKRNLISNFGLFDTIFSPGYDEENDFCMRINEIGYSAVTANRAFVYHLGSKSFDTKKRDKLQEQHHQILLGRYPYYNRTVRDYLDFRMDPIDVFADFIFPTAGRRPRILLDASSLGPVHNGSSRVAIPVLQKFSRAASEDPSIGHFTIRAPAATLKFFRMDRFGFPTIATDSADDSFFDVGFAISPIWHMQQIKDLNSTCARWVLTHFDVIALRTHSLLDTEFARRQVVLDSVRFADDVVTISDFSAADLSDFFSENISQASGIRTKTLTLGAQDSGTTSDWQDGNRANQSRSILVIGNHFKHKQVLRAVENIVGLDARIVVLGGNETHKISENVEVIPSGSLTDQSISDLYAEATCVVFPSHYEGYGLPIAEAQLHHKPMVLFDSAVSREVVADIGFEDGAVFFSRFDELPDAIRRAKLSSPVLRQARRTIDDFADEIFSVVIARSQQDANTDRLRSRVEYFRSLLTYETQQIAELNTRLNRRAYRAVDKWLNFVARQSKFWAVRTTLRPKEPAIRGTRVRAR